MFDPNRLKSILSEQKEVLSRLEQEANQIIHADLTKENERLKTELNESKESIVLQHEKLKAATNQNRELKNALYEHAFNRKISILEDAEKMNQIYFGKTANTELNRLAQLEQHLKQQANHLKKQLEKHNSDAHDELIAKLNILTEETEKAVITAREEASKAYKNYTSYSQEQFATLKNEQITDEAIEAIGKKNNLEAFIGGNLINKVGVLFIILGIITVSQFAFFQMPDTARAVIMFAISGLFLAAGEFMNRRKDKETRIFSQVIKIAKPTVFSLGLTSIGIAGSYASLAVSYFMFEIISMIPALLLCVLITAVAFVLSTRYNSQTIATFALVGGYIPMASVSDNAVLIYSAMGYFVILNLLALSLSFYKKWRITMFVGFTLNFAGTVFILSTVHDLWLETAGNQPAIAIVYALFAFAIYTVVPIVSSYRTKRGFSMPDVVMFGLNTVISAVMMYAILFEFDLTHLNGATALVFAVIYIGLGWIMGRLFTGERHTIALFYLTGLIFVILVVPLQLDIMWVSLGWLVQAVALACYGIITGAKWHKRAGYIIGGLCLAAFISVDVAVIDNLFTFRYLAVTSGSILVLSALAYKKSIKNLGEVFFKYAVLINSWGFSIYLVSLAADFVRYQLKDTSFHAGVLTFSMYIAVTFLFSAVFAIILPRIPNIADRGTKIISVCLSILGMILLVGNTFANRIVVGSPPLSVMIIATIIIIVFSGIAMLAMRSVLLFFVVEGKLFAESLPFCLSIYFLFMLTQNLIVQYNMAFTSIALSIIYVIASLLWIIFGFVKRFVFMRRFGLCLSVLAIAKLFLLDLPGLTDGHRIVSYFAFGATLLGISFVYQYFSKHFTLKLSDTVEDRVEDEEHGAN